MSRPVWAAVLARWEEPDWLPSTDNLPAEWWASRLVSSQCDLATAIVLVWWMLWKHRNAIVFDGASPDVARVLRSIVVDGSLWRSGGLFKG
ncbi:hypothetical protein BRADI_1g45514v3 [Brachypodium distachyon]|uniref:Uncharacterized protein n=1 Tax=Brachypodium distachyon TaxID=15368 RepID=A0A2K2DPJ3_BRADI|nr:hypothetical protein BRADI_1g45514v3 [Brachypodium distachyon]